MVSNEEKWQSILDSIDENKSVLLLNWNSILNPYKKFSSDQHNRSNQLAILDLSSTADDSGDSPSTQNDSPTPDQHLILTLPPLPEHTFDQNNRSDSKIKNFFRIYFKKMSGTDQKSPPRDHLQDILLSFLGSFISIAILGAIDFYFLLNTRFTSEIPAFGAMAVILFTHIGQNGWMAQPRNAFFGHFISAIIGVTCQKIIPSEFMWISAPLAVSITIALMSLTHTMHPAAGATALACIYGGPRITGSGWWFVIVTVIPGSIFMIMVTLLINNLSTRRKYPLYWY